jgi:MFS family permease
MESTNRGNGPFLLLCLIGFATFFSSYLRMPVLPLFAAQLGAGPAQVGLINGAFMVTAGVLSIPAGLLVDRFGRKRPVIAGILATALSSLFITLCHTPGQMAAAYLLFGVGLAAVAPGMLSLVADTVPPEKLGQAYGWYTTAIYMAMTLGPASGGYLAEQVGLRQLFLVSGDMLLLVAVTALLMLPPTAARRKTEMHAALAGTVTLLHNRPLRACLLATAGSCIGFGLFVTFLPLYGADHGLDPTSVGLIFAAQAVTNVVGRVPIGMLGDRVDRRLLVAAGLCFLAAALAILGQLTSLTALMLCAVGMGIGMALAFTAISTLIAETTPNIQRGLAMGMYNSCIYLGMMAGSASMGVALRWVGYPAGFAVGGVIVLATMILFLLLMRAPGGEEAVT